MLSGKRIDTLSLARGRIPVPVFQEIRLPPPAETIAVVEAEPEVEVQIVEIGTPSHSFDRSISYYKFSRQLCDAGFLFQTSVNLQSLFRAFQSSEFLVNRSFKAGESVTKEISDHAMASSPSVDLQMLLTLDYSSTDQESSVYGPGAYFYDLMRVILSHVKIGAGTIVDPKNAKYSLLSRRPDLLDIALNGINTSQVMIPTLSLVNYVLTRQLLQLEDSDLLHSFYSETGAKTERNFLDLLSAYEDRMFKKIANDSSYINTFHWPFVLFYESLKAYLPVLGKSVYEVSTLLSHLSSKYDQNKLSKDYLEISTEDCKHLCELKRVGEEDIQRQPCIKEMDEGVTLDPSTGTFTVDTRAFCKAAGIDYERLGELLHVDMSKSSVFRYVSLLPKGALFCDVNADNPVKLKIDHEKRQESIVGLTVERIKRLGVLDFVTKKLECEVTETELVLRLLGVGGFRLTFTERDINKLALVKKLCDKLKLPIANLFEYFSTEIGGLEQEVLDSLLYSELGTVAVKEGMQLHLALLPMYLKKISTPVREIFSNTADNPVNLLVSISSSYLNLQEVKEQFSDPENHEEYFTYYADQMLSYLARISNLSMEELGLVYDSLQRWSLHQYVQSICLLGYLKKYLGRTLHELAYLAIYVQEDPSALVTQSIRRVECNGVKLLLERDITNAGSLLLDLLEVHALFKEKKWNVDEHFFACFNLLNTEAVKKNVEIQQGLLKPFFSDLRKKDAEEKVRAESEGTGVSVAWLLTQCQDVKFSQALEMNLAPLFGLTPENFHNVLRGFNDFGNRYLCELIISSVSAQFSEGGAGAASGVVSGEELGEEGSQRRLAEQCSAVVLVMQRISLLVNKLRLSVDVSSIESDDRVESFAISLHKAIFSIKVTESAELKREDETFLLEFRSQLSQFLIENCLLNSIKVLLTSVREKIDVLLAQRKEIDVSEIKKVAIDFAKLSKLTLDGIDLLVHFSPLSSTTSFHIDKQTVQRLVDCQEDNKVFSGNLYTFLAARQKAVAGRVAEQDILVSTLLKISLSEWMSFKGFFLELDATGAPTDFIENSLLFLHRLAKLKQLLTLVSGNAQLISAFLRADEKYIHGHLSQVVLAAQPVKGDKAIRKIEERKRDILVNLVLRYFSSGPRSDYYAAFHINTPDQLSEYLLVDVLMSGEDTITPIILAHMTMQWYLRRCIEGVEESRYEGLKIEVNIPEKWWAWIENYRVWEANRKVFLYPENFLSPDLRITQSDECKQFSGGISKSYFEDESIRQAYLQYVKQVMELKEIKLATVCAEPLLEGNHRRKVHIFGTRNTLPKQVYHCTAEQVFTQASSRQFDFLCADNGDLYILHKENTRRGVVILSILTAIHDYQYRSAYITLPVDANLSTDAQFLFNNATKDIWLIRKNPADIDISIFFFNKRYQEKDDYKINMRGCGDETQFLLGASATELYVIKKYNTASNKVEVTCIANPLTEGGIIKTSVLNLPVCGSEATFSFKSNGDTRILYLAKRHLSGETMAEISLFTLQNTEAGYRQAPVLDRTVYAPGEQDRLMILPDGGLLAVGKHSEWSHTRVNYYPVGRIVPKKIITQDANSLFTYLNVKGKLFVIQRAQTNSGFVEVYALPGPSYDRIESHWVLEGFKPIYGPETDFFVLPPAVGLKTRLFIIEKFGHGYENDSVRVSYIALGLHWTVDGSHGSLSINLSGCGLVFGVETTFLHSEESEDSRPLLAVVKSDSFVPYDVTKKIKTVRISFVEGSSAAYRPTVEDISMPQCGAEVSVFLTKTRGLGFYLRNSWVKEASSYSCYYGLIPFVAAPMTSRFYQGVYQSAYRTFSVSNVMFSGEDTDVFAAQDNAVTLIKKYGLASHRVEIVNLSAKLVPTRAPILGSTWVPPSQVTTAMPSFAAGDLSSILAPQFAAPQPSSGIVLPQLARAGKPSVSPSVASSKGSFITAAASAAASFATETTKEAARVLRTPGAPVVAKMPAILSPSAIESVPAVSTTTFSGGLAMTGAGVSDVAERPVRPPRADTGAGAGAGVSDDVAARSVRPIRPIADIGGMPISDRLELAGAGTAVSDVAGGPGISTRQPIADIGGAAGGASGGSAAQQPDVWEENWVALPRCITPLLAVPSELKVASTFECWTPWKKVPLGMQDDRENSITFPLRAVYAHHRVYLYWGGVKESSTVSLDKAGDTYGTAVAKKRLEMMCSYQDLDGSWEPARSLKECDKFYPNVLSRIDDFEFNPTMFAISVDVYGGYHAEGAIDANPYGFTLLNGINLEVPENLSHFLVNAYATLITKPLHAIFSIDQSSLVNVCADDLWGQYYWELMHFVPMILANRLQSTQQFDKALTWYKGIFDPTVRSRLSSSFIFAPFIPASGNDIVNPLLTQRYLQDLHEHAFEAHRMATLRGALAYKKYAVMRYVRNLVAWGDACFLDNTRETIHEALSRYLAAKDLLGEAPRKLYSAAYDSKKQHCSLHDLFIRLQKAEDRLSGPVVSRQPLVIYPYNYVEAAYFYLPENSEFMALWTDVDDRLYKIRHCLSITGIKQQLALLSPEIDPHQLVTAVAARGGEFVRDILASVSGKARPPYRFLVLLQRAKEFASYVERLGESLLSVLERKDAAELVKLNNEYAQQVLGEMTSIKKSEVDQAQRDVDSLFPIRRSMVDERIEYYTTLLKNGGVIKDESRADLHRDGQFGAKVLTNFAIIQSYFAATVPDFMAFGPIAGGSQASEGLKVAAGLANTAFITSEYCASVHERQAMYMRRKQEWRLQLSLVKKEKEELALQEKAAELHLAVAKTEMKRHLDAIEHQARLTTYNNNQFTNLDLYTWMAEQLLELYSGAYNLALRVANQTVSAYQYELGTVAPLSTTGFWSKARQGLLSGVRLTRQLQELEQTYIENHKRLPEIEKVISVRKLYETAHAGSTWAEGIAALKEGGIEFTLESVLFDRDFSIKEDEYRRIKMVQVTVPALGGPHQQVNLKLVCQRSGEEIYISKSIASTGMFSTSLDDARYLPFEGIDLDGSAWTLALGSTVEGADLSIYDSLSDIQLRVYYTIYSRKLTPSLALRP